MIRILHTILFITSLAHNIVVAQVNNIRFRHINIDHGLSSNTVWSIGQDHDGFMWFGTNDGLNKYDGYNFTLYRRKFGDTLSLSSSRIIDILVAEDGNLWIGTSDGLNYFLKEKNQFQRFDSPAFESLYVRCLVNNRKGQLWVGTSDGLYQFDTKNKKYVINNSYPENPYIFLDRNIKNITEDRKGIIWLSTTEGLYIMENGVIFKASVMGAHPILSSKETFRDVLQDSNGEYWIATESTEKGVFHFDSEMNLRTVYSNIIDDENSIVGNRVRIVRQLSDEKIWLGTFDGLSILNSDEKSFVNYQSSKYDLSSLSYNSVRDIFEDQDGGIWVATYSGGVNYFHPRFQKFSHVKEGPSMENNISNNHVWTFAQEGSGNIWIGTDNGLNYLDFSTNSFNREYSEKLNSGLLDKTIKALAIDRQNKLWIGSFLGLSLCNNFNKEFRHFVHSPLDSNTIGYGHVHTICEDVQGQIWIGTNGGGLNRYNPTANTFDRFYRVEGEADEAINLHINSIIDYNNDFLWIVTEGGLELFDKNKELFTRSKLREDKVFNVFSSLNILSQYLDKEGNLWIGTHGEGLFMYNTIGGEVYIIKDLNGLPNNTINSILQDGTGNIWISTNHGISKLTKPKDGWNNINETHIVNFNTTDGLQGAQYFPRSAFKSRDGQLFMGGTNGYNSFYPEKVKKSIIQPEVVFTDIRFLNNNTNQNRNAGNEERNVPGDTIEIEFIESNFSIEFAGLNYFDPKQTYYAYKLEPSDQDWNIIGNERVVNYSKLPPGDYIFKVRATNNILDWGESFSQLHIKILPPFWRTWWAYLLYFSLLVLLLYLFFRYATKWGKLKSDLEWEHLEREKEHELHQMRIKFFTDISHELRTPLTLILAPLNSLVRQFEGSSRLKNQLLMIQRNSERMLQLINQLLDLRKLETGHLNLKAGEGNIVKFVREVSLAFREVAKMKNIEYDFYSENDNIKVWFDRDKFEIILYNLLSNAMKYTPQGGSVGLSLSLNRNSSREHIHEEGLFREGYLEISVEDNGRGIPPENLDKIFDRFYQSEQKNQEITYGSGVGLEIVKKFVDLHKGKIKADSIESKAGQQGKTRFSIWLPIGRKHLTNDEIIKDFKTSDDISLYKNSAHDDAKGTPVANSLSLSKEEEPAKSNEMATLLVVEDNDEVRSFIVSLFESEYEVLEASDGKQGLDIALDKIPDMVLSDIMMPVMDGLELCKQIKSDSRTSHVPVTLLTARTAVTFQIEGIETGADDYVTKPFSSDLLKTRVRKLIEQRRNLISKFGKGPGLIPENVSVTSVDEKLMKKAIDFINENIAESDLNVERVAGEVGLSRVHFYRKIKALTNISPVEFIRYIRLERAAQLLRTGKLNVSEVRYSVGIQETEYFRKSFKKQFGKTPSEYSKEHNPS